MTSIDLTESRYHRQELITWWDQSRLRAAKVLVVGAGAIGNEVVKNLALVGIGQIEVCDMDTIEHSNLARCVFFRESHEGSFKAEVLASEVMRLNPDVAAVGHPIAVQRLGIGYLADFDIVIGALDNREARAWVNQACRKLGKFWIDAAIEGLRGLVRTFGPEGACYACTLSEADWQHMSHRRSCALLAPEEILSGKTPTNATTAGIVAGVQVQEAIKYLVNRQDLLSLVGKCWVYTGDSMATYVTGYPEDDYCMAHDRFENWLVSENVTTLADLIDLTKKSSQENIVAIDLEDDLVELRACPNCGGSDQFKLRSSLSLGAGRCESCGKELAGSIRTAIEPTEALVKSPLEQLGLPMKDIITIRTENQRFHYVVGGK